MATGLLSSLLASKSSLQPTSTFNVGGSSTPKAPTYKANTAADIALQKSIAGNTSLVSPSGSYTSTPNYNLALAGQPKSMGVQTTFPSTTTPAPTLAPQQVKQTAPTSSQGTITAATGWLPRADGKGVYQAGTTDPSASPSSMAQNTATATTSGSGGTSTGNKLNAVDKDGNLVYIGNPDLNRNMGYTFINEQNPYDAAPVTQKAPQADVVNATFQNAQPNGYAGLIQQLVNTANGGQNVRDAYNQLNQFQSNLADRYAQNRMNPIPLEFQQGREQVIQQANAGKLQALSQQVANAAALQGQQITGLGSAIGYAQPTQISPESTLVDPVTGQPRYGLGNTGGAGSNAYTNWQIQQQNATQGRAYQGQAADLSNTLRQIDTLTPVLTNFMQKANLNPGLSPLINQPINTYLQILQPDDRASLNAYMADLRTYTAQILGSSGLNPTDVANTVNSYDFSGLSATQLKNFTDNLRNMGEIRLQPLQQSASASYGAGANPFMGATATPSANSTVGTPNFTGALANPIVGATAGTVMNVLGSAEALFGAGVGLGERLLRK